jgi:hypothetical protein
LKICHLATPLQVEAIMGRFFIQKNVGNNHPPDEFLKKIAQNVAQTIFDNINRPSIPT